MSDPEAGRPVSICAVVDCVGALATRTMDGNLYFYDTNRIDGSTGIGTEHIRTKVRAGDRLLWTVIALECEAFVSIDAIDIDPAVCRPERKVYPGTDVAYWIGTVNKGVSGITPYEVAFKVGTRPDPLRTSQAPVLVAEAASVRGRGEAAKRR